jgi:hypothetical protein
MPVIVARRRARGRLPDLGLAEAYAGVPVVAAMLRAYPGGAGRLRVRPRSAWPRRRAGAGSRRRCSRRCARGCRGARACCSSGATTPPRCGRTPGWACARSRVHPRRRRDGGAGLRRVTATGARPSAAARPCMRMREGGEQRCPGCS